MMLKLGVKQLIQVTYQENHEYEHLQNKINKDKWIRDHLPFGDKIEKIAKTMPNAPQLTPLNFDVSPKIFQMLNRNLYYGLLDDFKKYNEIHHK